jgi:hypothetical protein
MLRDPARERDDAERENRSREMQGLRLEMLVCNWLHSVGQNYFHVMMLLNRDSVIFRVFLFRVILLEDSAQIPSQRNRILCIRPNDVIFHLDTQLSKHHLSGRRELSVRTFLCVENLRTVPGCIRPDVSATRMDAFQCSTRKMNSFQNTDMERQLQSSGRYP